MSRPQTHEQRLLYKADQYLSYFAHTHEERLQILEAVAATKSHCDVTEYWKLFDFSCVDIDASVVNKLLKHIEESGVPVSMAISSLAREPLSVEEQKKNGVFYTDFRLAKYIAKDCSDKIKEKSTVADFAAGTGILIVGIAEEYKQKFPKLFDTWIAHRLYAFDLSSIALRGAKAALLSLTSNVDALKAMSLNWKTTDSLLDNDISKLKFDIIVGNPPWGKIKLSRHDFLTQNGEQRTYGTEYENFDHNGYERTKESLSQYSKLIKQKYNLLGNAEPDMYMAFLQRVTEGVSKGGHISYLVPAGLIRSQGTQVLRRYLFSNANRIEFGLLDNQANYFAIDTRFKFVLLSFDKHEHTKSSLEEFLFSMPTATSGDVTKGNSVCFDIAQLEATRSDLTIPEVGSEEEKNLFFKICENGQSWGQTDNVWFADISREVDMTNNRKHFVASQENNAIPVIEGRMVQQHRFGTKTYISGSGRSAKWAPCSIGGKSQFYYPIDKMSDILLKRTCKTRAGYCDIAGQTNERAMMSAIIPPNVVCGNKVPTILFPKDTSGDLIYLWIGITNSFVFDWMIRRIISTTVNYFLLFSIPMPDIAIDSNLAKTIIQKTKQLSIMNGDYYTSDKMAELRSDIDVYVAEAYGLGTKDMELIMNDFPLLDRKQPHISTEKRSTVTRDLVLSKCELHFDSQQGEYFNRYVKAREKNALAYIPTEMTELSIGGGV